MTSSQLDRHLESRPALTGLTAGLAALTMLFSALASAYVVRRGISADWRPVPLSRTPVYVSVLPLLMTAGSLAIASRRTMQSRGKWIAVAMISAAVLTGSHIYTWLQLRNDGISLSTGPAAAFFFVLGTAYDCCVIAGFFWMLTVGSSRSESRLKALSYYWQYLAVLWLSLLLLISLWP